MNPNTIESLAALLQNPKAFDAKLAEVDDPAHRDLLLLQLAGMGTKTLTISLCRKIQTENAKRKMPSD